jgi:hypothetical protein
MSGNRLMPNDKLQAKAVQLGFQLVDIQIPQDDRIGQLAIAFREGLEARFDRSLSEPGHLDDLSAQLIDIPLQGFFKMIMRAQGCTQF